MINSIVSLRLLCRQSINQSIMRLLLVSTTLFIFVGIISNSVVLGFKVFIGKGHPKMQALDSAIESSLVDEDPNQKLSENLPTTSGMHKMVQGRIPLMKLIGSILYKYNNVPYIWLFWIYICTNINTVGQKIKKKSCQKNSRNQINQFHEFFLDQIPFFAIPKMAKNQFLNWEKV